MRWRALAAFICGSAALLGATPSAMAEDVTAAMPPGKTGDAQELGKSVSGVFVNAPVAQGGYAPDFMFRGFDNGGVILRDGVARGFGPGGVELAGVERTEFVKGVVSLLYGTTTSAFGAAANYILKKPEADYFLRGDASLGSFGFRRATLDLNTPLDPEKTLLFRGNLALQESKSFVDYVFNRGLYANPSVTKIFDNGDRLTLRGEANLSNSLTNFGLPTYLPSPLFLTLPRNLYAAVPANGGLRSNRYDASLRYEHAFNENWGATLVADYYRSLGAYGWLTGLGYAGGSEVSFGNGAHSFETVKNFDVQPSLKGKIETGPFTHNLFFGYERWSFDDSHKDEITAYSLGSINVFAPLYPGFVSYAAAQPASGIDSSWSNSAYAQDAIDIGPQVRLLLGGRYDYLASYQTIDDPTGALTGAQGSTASKGFFSKLTPRVGALMRPFENFSIHAGFGRSFIPNNGVRLEGGKLAPPEEDALYEIGARHSLFDKKLDVDLGVFDVTRDNVAALNPLNPTGFYSVVTGQQHSHGVEVGLGAQPTENLRLGLAATFLHAVVSRDSNTPSQAGSDLLGAPRRVFNLSANYNFDAEPLRGLSLSGNFYYASQTQATLPNTYGFVLPPKKMLSFSASYKLNDHVSVTLSGSNLTDGSNFSSTGVLLRGEPRTINMSASYKY